MMWQESASNCNLNGQEAQNTPTISPNLIKMLNVYTVLEPKRVTTEKKQDLLIDFDSPIESHNSHHDRKLETNLIELEDSKGFDPIDVYQNILVSPQLVNKTPQSQKEINNDFEEFFRKLELGQKDDLTKSKQDNLQQNKQQLEKKESTSQYVQEFDSLFDTIAEQKTSVVNNNIINYEENEPVDHEELIREVLLSKTIEKIKHTNNETPVSSNNIKLLSTPPILNNNAIKNEAVTKVHPVTYNKLDIQKLNNSTRSSITPVKIGSSDVPSLTEFENITHYSQSKSSSNKPNVTNHKEHISLSSTSESIVGSSRINLATNHVAPDTVMSKSPPKISTRNTKLLLLKDVIKELSEQKKAEKLDKKQINILDAPVDPGILKSLKIKPIMKDEKKFAKYCKRVSDVEKLKYTKGPTMHEKAIVTPQIMGRLNERKMALEAEKNVVKRLILDTGTAKTVNSPVSATKRPMVGIGYSYANDSKGPVAGTHAKNQGAISTSTVDLNPIVLQEDCNSERLIAFKTRKAFDKLVRAGNRDDDWVNK